MGHFLGHLFIVEAFINYYFRHPIQKSDAASRSCSEPLAAVSGELGPFGVHHHQRCSIIFCLYEFHSPYWKGRGYVRVDNKNKVGVEGGIPVNWQDVEAEGLVKGLLSLRIAEQSSRVNRIRTDYISHEFLQHIVVFHSTPLRAYCTDCGRAMLGLYVFQPMRNIIHCLFPRDGREFSPL